MSAGVMVREHRSQLLQLRGLADRDIVALLAAVEGLPVAEVRNVLIAALPELVEPYVSASGELAAVMFEDLRAEAGRRGVFYAQVPDVMPPIARIEGTARWAVGSLVDESLGSTVQSRMSGSVARMIMDASRDTMQANGSREQVRFQRMARAGACAFCGMLASRPPWMAYTSEAKANAASHDDCRCVVTPLYPGSEMSDLARVEREKWERMYRDVVATSDSGAVSVKGTLANWRQEHGTK